MELENYITDAWKVEETDYDGRNGTTIAIFLNEKDAIAKNKNGMCISISKIKVIQIGDQVVEIDSEQIYDGNTGENITKKAIKRKAAISKLTTKEADELGLKLSAEEREWLKNA